MGRDILPINALLKTSTGHKSRKAAGDEARSREYDRCQTKKFYTAPVSNFKMSNPLDRQHKYNLMLKVALTH